MAIVEVGLMGVQAGTTPMDKSSPDGEILIDAWHAVIKAPGGPQRVFWAPSVEDASRFWGFFDWHSLEEHEAFAKSFGGEATKRFGEMFTPGFTKHAHLQTDVLKSPVTEVMIAAFPQDMTVAQKEHVSQQFTLFQQNALDKCQDVRGVSAGWGLEADFPLLDVENSSKGNLFFALLGWGSIDEHMSFRETSEFKENVGILRNLDRCIKLRMFHLRCEQLSRTSV